MDKPCKFPNILRLTGVAIEDFRSPEDIMEQRLSVYTEEDRRHTEKPLYSPLPSKFVSLDLWPSTTNLTCWQCHFTFNSRPYFDPSYFKESETGIEMGVNGVFCCGGCAAKYIKHTYHVVNKRNTHMEWLYALHYMFTGNRVNFIQPSKSFKKRAKYGGTMSDGEYLSLLPKDSVCKKIVIYDIPASSTTLLATLVKRRRKALGGSNVWPSYGIDITKLERSSSSGQNSEFGSSLASLDTAEDTCVTPCAGSIERTPNADTQLVDPLNDIGDGLSFGDISFGDLTFSDVSLSELFVSEINADMSTTNAAVTTKTKVAPTKPKTKRAVATKTKA